MLSGKSSSALFIMHFDSFFGQMSYFLWGRINKPATLLKKWMLAKYLVSKIYLCNKYLTFKSIMQSIGCKKVWRLHNKYQVNFNSLREGWDEVEKNRNPDLELH